MSAIGSIIRTVVERSSRGRSYEDLTGQLQSTEASVLNKLKSGADTEKNRDRANHVIGLERWGQRRLSVALGEPLVTDEYDGCRPGNDQPLPALALAFDATRSETLGLVRRLQEAGGSPETTVPHNDLGPLSVRGWLFYLNSHAARESGGLSAT